MDIVKSHVPTSIQKCLHKVAVVSLGNKFEALERHIRFFKGMDILKSCRDPTFCVTWADILTKNKLGMHFYLTIKLTNQVLNKFPGATQASKGAHAREYLAVRGPA
jgi:hypothetical protein